MEQQLSAPECKNMDACLRRLKQELLSMKEAGDGLHHQMNSMMGALQELKLLQVQTALENLDISGRPINRGMPHPAQTAPLKTSATAPEKTHGSRLRQTLLRETSPSSRLSIATSDTFSHDANSPPQTRSSLGSSSSSASSLQSADERNPRTAGNDNESKPNRWSGYNAPQVDFYGPMVGNPPQETSFNNTQACARANAEVVDLPGILYSLSREGPSIDSEYSQDSMDDASDWTSSLMSRSRNRQPLVLGDNVFADLVGNWLDLPEVEREEVEEEGGRRRREERTGDGVVDRPDTPAHPLRLSRSQEICRKFSLTTNIFKKFLRGVRPDRDKLLKERPGWMAPELPEGDLFKRSKKQVPKSSKGSFYLPFWANGQQSKGRPCPRVSDEERSHQHHFPHLYQPPFAGIYLDRRQPESGPERMHPLFDHNTAVWV